MIDSGSRRSRDGYVDRGAQCSGRYGRHLDDRVGDCKCTEGLVATEKDAGARRRAHGPVDAAEPGAGDVEGIAAVRGTVIRAHGADGRRRSGIVGERRGLRGAACAVRGGDVDSAWSVWWNAENI